MVINCPECSCRFRVDDAKVPSGSFTVACPKCQIRVAANSTSSVHEESALGAGNSPATTRRFGRPVPAPLFKGAMDEGGERVESNPLEANGLAAALLTLMKTEKGERKIPSRPSWDRRRVLVCTERAYRDQIARGLTANNYDVFVADDTEQAIERMRESQVDVVLLDSSFDLAEQGSAFVMREVNVLRPAERRRLFFVSLSSSKRTMDGHTSFLNSTNLIINLSDIAGLPEILDRSLREFNELYREFNVALNAAPL